MGSIVIVVLVGVLVFLGLMWYEEIKGDREIKLRQTDRKLQNFYSEMNTDRNDGWTKGHYKLLYEERLKELKGNKI
jgi:hypothetical protein